MKNLKVWQKLFLLGLVFLLPFAVVTFSLISSVNTAEIEFAELETEGVDYIAPVRVLLKELQLHRTYAGAYLNGDTSFQGRFKAQQGKVERALTAIDQVDQRFGASLQSTSEWQKLKAECQALFAVHTLQPLSSPVTRAALASPQGQQIQKAIDQHSQVVDDVVAFITHVGDVSKLTLDPDLDSYYLMNIVVFTGPELIELLGKTRTAGLIVTTRRTMTVAQRADLVRMHAVSGHVLDAMEGSLDKALAANASIPAQHPELVERRTTSENAIRNYLRLVGTLIERGGAGVSSATYAATATNAIDEAYEMQNQISPTLRDLLTARLARSSGRVKRTLAWALAGLIVVSLIGVLLVRDITQPLNHLVRAAKQISTGNLAVQLPDDKRNDEVGVLTSTFNHMTMSLQKLAGAAGQIAGGDLTTRVQAQSEQDALGNAFATMSENIHQMVGDLTAAVSVLGSSASEIVASTSQLAAGATQTATAVSETTTTVEEIRQTAEVSNQKARHVAENAQKLAHISQSGKKAAEDSRQGMNRIRQQMGSIADSMGELSEQSQAIGAIIATVDDLTQQSNLLAVNAAIEAAKAGEQGKGFAVVAQEVKSLAEQSRQATAQVRSILSDIQKATSAAVMATEQGSKAVEAGVQQAGLAGESIVSLTENVTEAAHAATQIAASSQQQLVGMEQMVLAMESIKQASTQNVDSARQLEASARDLGELGQQLRQLVEHYKV